MPYLVGSGNIYHLKLASCSSRCRGNTLFYHLVLLCGKKSWQKLIMMHLLGQDRECSEHNSKIQTEKNETNHVLCSYSFCWREREREIYILHECSNVCRAEFSFEHIFCIEKYELLYSNLFF